MHCHRNVVYAFAARQLVTANLDRREEELASAAILAAKRLGVVRSRWLHGIEECNVALNLTRFQADLARLLEKGHDLQLALIAKTEGKAARKQFEEAKFKDEDIEKILKESGRFSVDYQAWYSECIALIKQILPDRVKDFRDQYERPSNRKEIDFLSYVISDAIIGLQTSRGGEVVANGKAAVPKFQTQLAILGAAQARFKSSLFEIRQIVQADLFDSEIDSARELLKNKFLRASGAIAGVVLEKHLRQVCDDHNIKITKKHPTINDLNELLKSNGVIDVPQWRHVSMLGDIRNLCDHNKQKEPTEQQVSDLIDGTDKVLKTIS